MTNPCPERFASNKRSCIYIYTSAGQIKCFVSDIEMIIYGRRTLSIMFHTRCIICQIAVKVQLLFSVVFGEVCNVWDITKHNYVIGNSADVK